jgi:hypothetical protein
MLLRVEPMTGIEPAYSAWEAGRPKSWSKFGETKRCGAWSEMMFHIAW